MLPCRNPWAAVIAALRRWGFSGPWNLPPQARMAIRISPRILLRPIAWISKLSSMVMESLAPASREIMSRPEP